MNKQQLEISLPTAPCVRRLDHKRRSADRAQWWFERMRRAVDAARPVHPAPASPKKAA